MMSSAPKSRLAYILLAIFLGSLGIHSFYAGYTKTGLVQLLLTLLTVGFGGIISCIWAIVNAITVSQDASGRRMI